MRARIDCPERRAGTTIGLRIDVGSRLMGKRIVFVGAGAVGTYTGAHMAKAGEDVTYIDFWPENVEAINRDGIRITHHQGPDPFNVKVRAIHLTEAQHLAKEAPVDIAFVCVKS